MHLGTFLCFSGTFHLVQGHFVWDIVEFQGHLCECYGTLKRLDYHDEVRFGTCRS